MEELLPFGKHKGKGLSAVPRNYVHWLSQQTFSAHWEREARAFLLRNPIKNATPPRTLQEASKLGWMAERNYSDARERLLACRDDEQLLVVVDEDSDDERNVLIRVSDNGTVTEANFFWCTSVEQARTLLARYPVDPQPYLEDVEEHLNALREDAARTLRFDNPKHTVELCIWGKDTIDVTVDGVEYGVYHYRLCTPDDPPYGNAVALLEPDEDLGGYQVIGLTAERNTLFEEKLKELNL